MTRSNTYVLIAALAVSGMGFSARAADNTAPFNNSESAAQMQQVGGQIADESTAKSVRNTLAKVVNDALSPKYFPTVTSYLSKADKERFGDVKSLNQDELNNAINQFRQDFKNKYNQDFDISSDQLKNALVYAGQDKNAATVTFARPNLNGASSNSGTSGSSSSAINSPPNGATENNTQVNGATADRTLNTLGNDKTVSNRAGDNSGAGLTTTSDGNRTGPASNGSNSNSTVRGNDVTATPGTVATNNTGVTNANTGNVSTDVTNTRNNIAGSANNGIANAAGMSSLTLNLVNEGHVMNAWRISSPQLSAEQLKQNLTKHIQMLDDQKAAWPADANTAYQAASYHILSAFSDSAVASER